MLGRFQCSELVPWKRSGYTHWLRSLVMLDLVVTPIDDLVKLIPFQISVILGYV